MYFLLGSALTHCHLAVLHQQCWKIIYESKLQHVLFLHELLQFWHYVKPLQPILRIPALLGFVLANDPDSLRQMREVHCSQYDPQPNTSHEISVLPQ